MKYKNKQGIELNYTGTDSHQVLVREVVMVAIKMLDEYNWNDKTSMRFALHNCKEFLRENFNIDESVERSDEWRINQFNRNRAPEDQVHTIQEMEAKVKELFK
tara:strand:+ start:606 stop:914 length:309 start_codon:yes stop_codon:yes gene_type:complete